MNISILKKEISNTLEALAEQTEVILSHEGRIPQIEMDIAMGNIRKLYEDYYTLDKENRAGKHLASEQKLKPEKQEIKKEEHAVPHKEKASEVPEEKTPKTDPQENKPEPTRERTPPPVTEKKKIAAETEEREKPEEPEAKAPLAEKEQPAPKPKPEKAAPVEKSKDPVRTADLFAENNATLADKFRDEGDASLGARMQKNKITDLKDAIGINEKFLFINDLFDGNMQDYNNAVENINSMGTLEQAKSVISNLGEKYKWDVKPDAVNHFMSYVERRFSDV